MAGDQGKSSGKIATEASSSPLSAVNHRERLCGLDSSSLAVSSLSRVMRVKVLSPDSCRSAEVGKGAL